MVSASLQNKFALKLHLLDVGQLGQLVAHLFSAFKSAIADDVSGFAISFGLGYFIVFLSHVHVTSRVSSVFFAAIVQTRELFIQFFGGSSDVFLARHVFSGVLSGLKVVDHVHQVGLARMKVATLTFFLIPFEFADHAYGIAVTGNAVLVFYFSSLSFSGQHLGFL